MQMGWGKGLIVGGLIGLCLLPEIGWGQLVVNASGLLVAFAALGVLLVYLDRALSQRAS